MLGNSTKLRSEVVADVARLQVIALEGSLNSGESSYLKVRHGVAIQPQTLMAEIG